MSLTDNLLVTLVTLNVKYAVKTSHCTTLLFHSLQKCCFKKSCLFLRDLLPNILVYFEEIGADLNPFSYIRN